MSEKVIKKQRNVAIELWRFIMAIAIIGFHAGFIIARSCNETTGFFMEVSNWFFRLERNAARVHSDRRLFHGRAFHQAEKRSGVYVPQRREPRLGVYCRPHQDAAPRTHHRLHHCDRRLHQLLLSRLQNAGRPRYDRQQHLGVSRLPRRRSAQHGQRVLQS